MGSAQGKVLVAIGGSPWSPRLIRSAHGLAAAYGSPWMALHFLGAGTERSEHNREMVRSALKLAESLGAETVIVNEALTAAALLAFARKNGVSTIVCGQEGRVEGKRALARPNLARSLLRRSGEIDVFLVHGEAPLGKPPRISRGTRPSGGRGGWKKALGTALVMAASLGLSVALDRLSMGEANVIMAHLLGTFFVAVYFGLVPGLAASVIAVLQFNFFFTEPRFTFAVANPGYLTVFAGMLVVAVMASSLASRMRRQAEIIGGQESRTYQLYLMGQSLAEAQGMEEIIREGCRQLKRVNGVESAFFLCDGHGKPARVAESSAYEREREDEDALARCLERGEPVGRGTGAFQDAALRYEPLKTEGVAVGAVCTHERIDRGQGAGEMRLDTTLSLIARALERERLIEERRQAVAKAQQERMRSSLLRSVSHDLRTPLSGIAGAAESLRYARLDAPTIASIATDIEEEAESLSLLVDNILNLTRLQEQAVPLRLSKESVDDLVYAAADKARKRYRQREISVILAGAAQVVEADPVLIQQLLLNFLDNAAKYSPPDGAIEISAERRGGEAVILVRDHGGGVPPDLAPRVFEKFVRGEPGDGAVKGSGLGLYICDTIAKAHGGRVFLEDAVGGGSVFGLALRVDSDGKEAGDA